MKVAKSTDEEILERGIVCEEVADGVSQSPPMTKAVVLWSERGS